MREDDPERRPALQSARQPSERDDSSLAQPGFDWSVLWNGIKSLIRSGKQFGGELEATTQTPADDELVGKTGLVTAKVASGKAGEIRLRVRGGTQDYIACLQAGAEPLEVNSPAEVVVFLAPNTVYVKPVG